MLKVHENRLPILLLDFGCRYMAALLKRVIVCVLQPVYIGAKAISSFYNESCVLPSVRLDCGNVLIGGIWLVVEARSLPASLTDLEPSIS